MCYNIITVKQHNQKGVSPMHINEILQLNGLSIEQLMSYSYKSQLGLSLKRTIKRFDKEALLAELREYTTQLELQCLDTQIAIDYRIKSEDSIRDKYDRYYPNTEACKVFNDILGFRAFCDDYTDIINAVSEELTIVDMSKGKRRDDGYRGVHVYFQIDNFHYPVELQFNTLFDRQLNNWLHDYVYKKAYPLEYGQNLRSAYELGKITDLHSFEVILNDLLSSKT